MTGQVKGDVSATAWVSTGNTLLLRALAELDDAALDLPSALPEWTRRSVIAHVAANAEAVLRLLSWARTGVESRMYSSPGQRAADIEVGSRLPAGELREWVARGIDEFDSAVAAMPGSAWSAEVMTAQGRTVPADEVLWMRAREVCIHAVDLGAGVGFDDLPATFCSELVGDVSRWRSGRDNGPALELTATDSTGVWHITGEGAERRIELPLAGLAAWLTGRTDRPGLPVLPSWL